MKPKLRGIQDVALADLKNWPIFKILASCLFSSGKQLCGRASWGMPLYGSVPTFRRGHKKKFIKKFFF
jgi:hypothetical protein